MSEKTPGKTSRRRFLSALGWTAAGAATVGAGAIPLARDGELGEPYPKVPSNDARLPPNGKKVLILGGGLSGLQAGVELSARGFDVTILEKTGAPGGKCKAWRDRRFGPEDDPFKDNPSFGGYIREHGIHAVWGFYNNLREFMGRYGWTLMDMPKDVSIYHFRDKDGRVSHIPNTSWVAPYDYGQLLTSLFRLDHLAKEDRSRAARMFVKLATFDYADERQRNYLDGMTFEEYGKKLGLPDTLIHTICDSLIEMAYFDNVDKASALTLANLVQLVAGSPDDIRVNLYTTPVSESFLQPMANFIASHGGRIHYQTEVTDLFFEGGELRGAKARPVPEIVVRRCSICGGLIVDGMEIGGGCPYCGADASMLRPIREYERTERSFTADYVICALDGPGLRRLIATARAAPDVGPRLSDPYFERILDTRSKLVYVCNLWYPGRGYWEKAVLDEVGRPALCFFATGFDHIGITINRSLRIRGNDGTAIQWSSEYPDRDVTVIETQIAKAENVAGTSSRDIAMKCHAELKAVMPDLPDPVSHYVNRWDNYTAYRVGGESRRPAVQSPIDNLLFIGDNAFVPHPAVFMEKTNVTAKWATNLILEKEGLGQHRIEILRSGTPSKLIGAVSMVESVYA